MDRFHIHIIGIHALILFRTGNLSRLLRVWGISTGLATVKRIIEAHGGKIRVESDGVGKGTVFRFTLPGASGNGDRENF
jgi:signal transduction histidine kinase